MWIGTADIKDLYVKQGRYAVPFLEVLAELLQRDVEVRLIHAKEPGQNSREDFDKYPILAQRLERVLCPRVHFKLMIFDLESAVNQFYEVWMGKFCSKCGRQNFCGDEKTVKSYFEAPE